MDREEEAYLGLSSPGRRKELNIYRSKSFAYGASKRVCDREVVIRATFLRLRGELQK